MTVLRLLHERGLGASSPFHPYLRILPQDHRLPLEWNEAELDLLQVTRRDLTAFPELTTPSSIEAPVVGLLPHYFKPTKIHATQACKFPLQIYRDNGYISSYTIAYDSL